MKQIKEVNMGEFTGALYKWMLTYMMKKFEFRFLLTIHDSVYIHIGTFANIM